MSKRKISPEEFCFDSIICPITRELPIRPVVAQDGKVYDQSAWLQYTKKKNKVKSPWSRKKISTDAYFSNPIKQLIEQAVERNQVPDELCKLWKEKQQSEHRIEQLASKFKNDKSGNSIDGIHLGDLYYHGKEVNKDLYKALNIYETGWSKSGNILFFARMMLTKALIPKTRSDMICIWSSLCQLQSIDIVCYAIFMIIEDMNQANRDKLRNMSMINRFDVQVKKSLTQEEQKMACKCAKKLSNFLKKNFEDDDDSSENDSANDEQDDDDDKEDQNDESNDNESESDSNDSESDYSSSD